MSKAKVVLAADLLKATIPRSKPTWFDELSQEQQEQCRIASRQAIEQGLSVATIARDWIDVLGIDREVQTVSSWIKKHGRISE